jgi:hypothetical protein
MKKPVSKTKKENEITLCLQDLKVWSAMIALGQGQGNTVQPESNAMCHKENGMKSGGRVGERRGTAREITPFSRVQTSLLVKWRYGNGKIKQTLKSKQHGYHWGTGKVTTTNTHTHMGWKER